MKNQIRKTILMLLMLRAGQVINAQQTVTDIDGNVYQTVTIGTQVWMKENLKTTKYQNGDTIGTTYPVTRDYFSESTPKYQWAYNGNDSIANTYGRLYTWYAATDSRNVCPTGWHVPTLVEWNTLITFLGGKTAAHGKLKETGTGHWNSPNSDATNESGFSGLPGGSHWPEINFDYIGTGGHWWSATQANSTEAWRLMLNYQYLGASTVLSSADKKIGWSIRCIEDPIPDSVKYFGQTPPGNQAEKFAPGIVSLPKRGEYIITFSTDYDECYFSTYSSDYIVKNYLAKRINNSWTDFTETLYIATFFSTDGGKIFIEDAGDILMAEDTTGGWGVPTILPSPINSSSYDDSYSETTEGVKYICSNRPGGLGKQYEIWRIDPLTNQAENLGPVINSTPRNITPYIAPDESYLIYTHSNGYYEHLYISFSKGDNGWTEPINMDRSGANINRLYQTCPKLSPDGKYLFYNSHNPDYADSSDIYWVSTSIIDTLKKIAFPTTVVNTPETENLISVFPNPSKNVFAITLESIPVFNTSAEIYSSNGKMVLKQMLNNSTSTIDLSGFSAGLYFLKVNTGSAIMNKKIIKE
jgi:uncharacterized protein (TIGR02145 family)